MESAEAMIIEKNVSSFEISGQIYFLFMHCWVIDYLDSFISLFVPGKCLSQKNPKNQC